MNATTAIDLQPVNSAAESASESDRPLDGAEAEANRLAHEVGLVRIRTHPLLLDTKASALLAAIAPREEAAREQLRSAKARFLDAQGLLWNSVHAALQEGIASGYPAQVDALRALEADLPHWMWAGQFKLTQPVHVLRRETSFVWRKHERLLKVIAEFQDATP